MQISYITFLQTKYFPNSCNKRLNEKLRKFLRSLFFVWATAASFYRAVFAIGRMVFVTS